MHVVRTGFAGLKGTRHHARAEVELDALGAAGDREFCLLDERARVLKTVQNPVLLTIDAEELRGTGTGQYVQATYWERPVLVEVCDASGPAWEAIMQAVGGGVRLARSPRTDVIWGRPVSIVTSGSIRALEDALGRSIDPARFRATLVTDTDEPWLEDAWLGRDLVVGEVVLRVGDMIPRCAVIDLDPETGRRGSRLLNHLAGIRPAPDGPLFGIDADVLVPGVVRPGDEISVRAES